jgi:hypothetical protein
MRSRWGLTEASGWAAERDPALKMLQRVRTAPVVRQGSGLDRCRAGLVGSGGRDARSREGERLGEAAHRRGWAVAIGARELSEAALHHGHGGQFDRRSSDREAQGRGRGLVRGEDQGGRSGARGSAGREDDRQLGSRLVPDRHGGVGDQGGGVGRQRQAERGGAALGGGPEG